jgi:uncharacterized protein (PEP-CTERM system associated)
MLTYKFVGFFRDKNFLNASLNNSVPISGNFSRYCSSIIIKKAYVTVIIFISSLYSHTVVAKNWSIEPVISVQETYNYNITLAPSGSEQADFITSITPGLRLNREGRRLDLQLDYNIQGLIYLDNSENNDYFNNLNINSQSEIIDEHLFVDFNLKQSPQNTSNTGRTSTDNLSVTEDRDDVLTYEITPRWEQRFGSFSNMDIRINRNEIISDTLSGSTSNKLEFSLSSGARFTRFLWDLKFENEKINNEASSNTRFTTLRGDLRYLVTRKFAFKFSIGKDSNDFSSSTGSVNGLLWRIGAVWNPSTRTSFEATVGERFFGSDIFVELSHITRRTRWSAKFTKEPSTTRATILDQQVFNLIDSFGEPIINPVIGEQAILNTDVPVQTSEVLIRSSLSGNVNYKIRKNTFDLNIYHLELDYQLTGDKEESLGARGTWNWDIGKRSQSVFNIGWDKQSLRTGVDDTYSTLEYRLNHRLTPSLSGNIGARYIVKDSNISVSEYDEARVFIGLDKTF